MEGNWNIANITALPPGLSVSYTTNLTNIEEQIVNDSEDDDDMPDLIEENIPMV